VVLPVTEEVARRVVTLPLYPTMSDQQVDWVVGAVEGALEASPA
jgi:dTDP-4-amino-4,6-dideoxygalactose transaminase